MSASGGREGRGVTGGPGSSDAADRPPQDRQDRPPQDRQDRPPRRRHLRGVDRGPQPIGSSLDHLVRGLAPPSRPSPSAATWGTVFSRWEDVVGPAVSRHARPLRLEAGLLVVAVDQPAWATQVRALGPRIVDQLAELTGERLDRLEVVVRL